MLPQELRFTGIKLHFRVAMQFIALMEEVLAEVINGEEQSAKLKIVNLH